MTSFTLADFDTLTRQTTDTQEHRKAINMDDLEKDKPYMMLEWREITFTVNGEERTQAIGTLDDDRDIWVPKSMQRKIEKKEGPYMFVYRGRKSDKWRTNIIDVICGDVLRAKGVIKDDDQA